MINSTKSFFPRKRVSGICAEKMFDSNSPKKKISTYFHLFISSFSHFTIFTTLELQLSFIALPFAIVLSEQEIFVGKRKEWNILWANFWIFLVCLRVMEIYANGLRSKEILRRRSLLVTYIEGFVEIVVWRFWRNTERSWWFLSLGDFVDILSGACNFS